MHWFIYALGAGWGHLTRTFALARAALKQDIDCTILTNSDYALEIEQSSLFRNTQTSSSARVRIRKLESGTKPAEVSDRVSELLNSDDYSHLIVDTFPRGLVGDLVEILKKSMLKSVLIARDLKPEYVQKFDVESFVARHYDLTINPGEATKALHCHERTIATSLWTVLDATELPSKMFMRSRLQVSDPEVPIVLISASGTADENLFYWGLSQSLTQHLPFAVIKILTAQPQEDDQAISLRHFPGMEVKVAADVIVGSAGYNTVAECQALNIPLIAFPQERLYDRQQERAAARQKIDDSSIAIVSDASEALETLRQLLADRSHKTTKPSYSNGTHAAVSAILKLA